jgi:hypothetical protein
MNKAKKTNAAGKPPEAAPPGVEETEDLVFHYSRERRLSRASPRVRALYENTPKPRFGLFSSLVDTKPKAMLFAAIVLICLIILLLLPATR